MSGYYLSKQDVDASSYDISPDGLEVAFAAERDKTGIDSNFDVILLPTCGCKPARDITRGQQGRRRRAALQPRWPPPGVHAAAHQAVSTPTARA